MRLEHVLHPEILFNQRGDSEYRKLIKEMLQCFQIENAPATLNLSRASAKTRSIFERYWNNPKSSFQLFVILTKSFVLNKSPTYYVPGVFCDALSQIDRNIKCSFLPENFLAYIAFPKAKFKLPKGGFLNGAYVRIGSSMQSQTEARLFSAVFIEDATESGEVNTASCNFTVWNGKTLYDCIPQFDESVDGRPGETSLRILCNILFNSILYIFHEQDQIFKLRPARELSNKKRKDLSRASGGYLNLCTVPVELLNFDYHRPQQYSVDSTVVRGHFRWQPHGPANSLLKLVWISEHERKFNVRQFDESTTSNR